jgi:hypothetical protein
MAFPVPGALSTFTRVSELVSIYEPPTTTTPASGPSPPDVIVVLSWMAAPARAVAKYTAGYAALFPTARIVLARTEYVDFLLHSEAAQRQAMAPVVEALCATPDARVLVTCFSNGGASKACRLAEAYRLETGKILPIHALVLDSCPGKATFARGVASLGYILPRAWYLYFPGMLLVCAFTALLLIGCALMGRGTIVERSRQILNDPQIVDVRANRCYIYSQSDEMVWWQDVLEHAKDAEAKGWAVRTELFTDSMHAAHVRADEQRYWRAVKSVWEESRLK